jgi:hypothetical protein
MPSGNEVMAPSGHQIGGNFVQEAELDAIEGGKAAGVLVNEGLERRPFPGAE